MIANGFQLIFVDSGSIGGVVSFSCELAKRGNVDLTTLASTENNGKPLSICDPGTIAAVAKYALATGLPPILGDKETIRLKHDELIIDAEGYLNGMSIQGATNSHITLNLEIKLSGPISIRPRDPLDNVEGVFLRTIEGQYIYGTDA